MATPEAQKFTPQPIRINRLVGSSPGVGYLPANQLPFWIGFILVATLIWQTFKLDLPTFLFIAFYPCGVFWALTGQKEWKFLEKLHNPHSWSRGHAKIQLFDGVLGPKPQLGRRKVKNKWVEALEDKFALHCYGRINLRNRELGFYLLSGKRKSLFRVVFGWETSGISSTITQLEAEKVAFQLAAGLREVPSDDTLTFEYSAFADDEERQEQLDELVADQQNPLAALLLYSQKARTRELRQHKLRNPRKIRIFATYTLDLKGKKKKQDLLAKVGNYFTSYFSVFAELSSGKKEEADQIRLQKVISTAFKEGFLRYDSVLNTIMKLDAQPLSAEQLWEDDYQELHNLKAPSIPQLLILDDLGLHTQINSHVHAASVLIEGERGTRAVPKTHREWIWLPTKKRFAGFMQLGKLNGGFASAKEQLRYLWNFQATNKLSDFKIITTISMGNRGIMRFNLERITRNSRELSIRALKDKTIDVASDMRANEAVQARMAIESGEAIVAVSTGIWLYRKNTSTLERDFAYLADCLSTTETERAEECTEDFWLQSLRYTWDALLTKPYDRRIYYLSREAVGFLPLMAPPTSDLTGVEFLSLEGGLPIFLDPFNNLMHLAFFATTRGGKSVLLAEYIMQFYVRGIPVVGFDFPRPTDGTSSFSDLVGTFNQLGAAAAYNDIANCSSNLLELPDLRYVSNPVERAKAIINFQVDAITVIVLGDVQDSLLENSVRSLVSQSLGDFHEDVDIKERYACAIEAGFGTPQWEDTPTLFDYLKFTEKWLSDHMAANADTASVSIREAAGQILEQLRGALRSRLGQAIGRPSSFKSDVALLIFALRGLSNNNEAAPLALSAYSALLRRAVESENSVFLIDESPILFSFPAIAKIVGQLCANGLKWGCRVLISGQTASNIYHSAAGNQILETVTTTLVGKIKPVAVESFVEMLDYDPEIVQKCAAPGFFPSRTDIRSNWIINRDGTYLEVGFYPSNVLLALTANNPDEQAARNRVMRRYADPCEGIAKFAELYVTALRSGIPMNEVGLEEDGLEEVSSLVPVTTVGAKTSEAPTVVSKTSLNGRQGEYS